MPVGVLFIVRFGIWLSFPEFQLFLNGTDYHMSL